MRIERYIPREVIEIVPSDDDSMESDHTRLFILVLMIFFIIVGGVISIEIGDLAPFIIMPIILISFVSMYRLRSKHEALLDRELNENTLRYLLINRADNTLTIHTESGRGAISKETFMIDNVRGFEISAREDLKSRQDNFWLNMSLKQNRAGSLGESELLFGCLMSHMSRREDILVFGQKLASVLGVERGDISLQTPWRCSFDFYHEYERIAHLFEVQHDFEDEITPPDESSLDRVTRIKQILDSADEDKDLTINPIITEEWTPDVHAKVINYNIITYEPYERLIYELKFNWTHYIGLSLFVIFMLGLLNIPILLGGLAPSLKVPIVSFSAIVLSILSCFILMKRVQYHREPSRWDFRFKESLLTHITRGAERDYHLSEASHIVVELSSVRTRSGRSREKSETRITYIVTVGISGYPDIECLSLISMKTQYYEPSFIYHDAVVFAHMISESSGLPIKIIKKRTEAS